MEGLTVTNQLRGVVVISERNVSIESPVYLAGELPATIKATYMEGTHEDYKVIVTLNVEKNTFDREVRNSTTAPATEASFVLAVQAKLTEAKTEIEAEINA